jgi:serine/threonine-protein kinase HipA
MPRHWDAVAQLAGLGDARSIISDLVEKTPGALASVEKDIPRGYPAPVRNRIYESIGRSVKRLADKT